MGAALTERCVPGEWQLARWVYVASQYRGDGLASLGADKPGLYHSGHLVNPGQGSSVTRDVYINQAWVYLQDGLNHLVLGVRQIVTLAVVTLAILIVALVQSAHKNHHVGILCLGHSLGSELSLRAGFVERASHFHTVIALNGIAHVTANVIHLGISKTGLDAVERQNLLLGLERRRTTAHSHHLDGILAHYEDALHLL